MSFEIFNPEALGEPRGWNHGLAWTGDGRVLFVAGQTGTDGHGRLVSADFVEQFARALDNVLAVVAEAGGAAESVARMTVFVTDMATYRASLKPLGAAYRERMGRHYPAMSLVAVAELVEPEAVVEIEATAIIS